MQGKIVSVLNQVLHHDDVCLISFIHGEGAPGAHWLGGWVGPRTGLDAKRKHPCPWWESNTDLPSHNPLSASDYCVSTL